MNLLRRVDTELCGGHWTRYSVTGPRGATCLTFGRPLLGTPFTEAYGVDFGYHSPRPMYDGQTGEENCELLGEVTCFYDGSGLRAHGFVAAFDAGDTEAIYAALEAEYHALFGAEVAR